MKFIALATTAVALAFSAPAAIAKPISFKGVCNFTAGKISGKNFVTLKCYKKSEPGNYSIRATKWESRHKDVYRAWMKHAGRRYTCTFTQNGYSYANGIQKNVDLTDCH